MTSSSREDTVSPSSSNTDRREHDNDLDDDDCISDLDSEISDPSHLEDIDPVSESRGASPQPINPLIVNNPFLPPHLQQPAWSSPFDILRPPPPQLGSIVLGKTTSTSSSREDTSPHHQPERQSSPSTPPLPRPLFKPHELATSPDRPNGMIGRAELQYPRPENHQSRNDRSPKENHSPGAMDFIKRALPHPAFPPHHEMLSHFAAVRADFLHREALIRDFGARDRGAPLDFHQHDLRVDFSKAHELARQEFGKQHEHFSAEALSSLVRQNSVLGSAS